MFWCHGFNIHYLNIFIILNLYTYQCYFLQLQIKTHFYTRHQCILVYMVKASSIWLVYCLSKVYLLKGAWNKPWTLKKLHFTVSSICGVWMPSPSQKSVCQVWGKSKSCKTGSPQWIICTWCHWAKGYQLPNLLAHLIM